MPYNAKKRRQYYQANKDEILEKQRQYSAAQLAADPERIRKREREKRRRQRLDPETRDRYNQQAREYRARNAEEIRQRKRAAYAANKNKMRQYRAANREKIQQWGMRQRHGPNADVAFARMWDKQSGCCYLCGRQMEVPQAAGKSSLASTAPAVDHDHRCCPPEKSCDLCRRGLACCRCNTLIGLAGDDPDLLCRIAENLRPALTVMNGRLACMPEQLQLDLPALAGCPQPFRRRQRVQGVCRPHVIHPRVDRRRRR